MSPTRTALILVLLLFPTACDDGAPAAAPTAPDPSSASSAPTAAPAPAEPAAPVPAEPAEPAEPVRLTLPGWSQSEGASSFSNERTLTFREGDAIVELIRWWGAPEHDGGPMEVVERSTVTVGGEELELLHTSTLDGTEGEADVVFLRGDGWQARAACRACSDAQRAAMLGGLEVMESDESQPGGQNAIDCGGPPPLTPRCPPKPGTACAAMWAKVEAWRAACEPTP
jgi:hypothetical protein